MSFDDSRALSTKTELELELELELEVDVALSSLSASLMQQPPPLFLGVVRRALDAARGLVVQLKEAQASPRATLARYDDAMLILGDAAAVASLARNAHPDKVLRDAADTAEQEIEDLSTEVQLDRGVYDALLGVRNELARDAGALDEGGKHLLDKTLQAMRRGGVDRDAATRARLRALRDELVRLGQEFDHNIVEDVRTVELDATDLEGLPDDYVRSHAVDAQGKVRLTTDDNDYAPFVTYARAGAARERLWRAYRQRARDKNLDVLDRMLRRRHELARSLGYESFAALQTESKMIGTVDRAATFIAEISEATRARASRDYAALLSRKRVDDPGAAAVDGWDVAYLSDRVCDERHGFSSQAMRPYLEYGRVARGVLGAMARLFGVQFREPTEAHVRAAAWHPHVQVYEVVDDASQQVIGRIYLDMHPREGKLKEYAQFTVRTGVDRGERRRLPEGALLCNFPDPRQGLALLDLVHLRTFFHEFGHLMHHVLGGKTPWFGVSGVATEWDFVEVPSQLVEEWVWDWETLSRFAVHHETGEVLPATLLDKARAADHFGKGLWVRQQMFLAAISLEYHRRDPSTFDTTTLLAELQATYLPFPFVPGTTFQTSFGHLTSHSALYYTFMWSLVIAKDLLSRFRSRGMADPVTARDYRQKVLEPGGSRPAAALCEAFLGRAYEVIAFRNWLNSGA
jgi:thimet oligopeptidase